MNQYDQQGNKHGYWEDTIDDWVVAEGYYIHGKQDGEWIEYLLKKSAPWYSNEDIHKPYRQYQYKARIITYKDDLMHGPFYSFNEYKEIINHGEYYEGNRVGKWICNLQFRNDNKQEISHYKIKYFLLDSKVPSKRITLTRDSKDRIVNIIDFEVNRIYAKQRFVNDEIVYYEDYIGNWYDNNILKSKCPYNIRDHIHAISDGRDEEDKEFFYI